MIPNPSGTTECDQINQILKQMMYGRRKVKKKRELGRGRERKEGENEGALPVTLTLFKFNIK